MRTLRLWPPVIECRSVKEVKLYKRTLRSEHAVATIGRVGWGADCHVRELDGGVRVARGLRVCVRGEDMVEGPPRAGRTLRIEAAAAARNW